jgi:hypothetical protein
VGAVVFAFGEGRASHRPWQNHELAEFYRAIDILGRAGLVVVPDMGISDEGDPWFAFCRGDTGDVIVHIARIDGLLVATSIASKEIVRGAELRNIIDAVTRIAPLGIPVADADRRLFLHPAVVLTAFIAAALAFTKQADAQETHSNAAAKGAEHHAPSARIFASLKAAAGEMFGAVPVASVDGESTLNGPAGIEASVSLAALISAATAVVGQAVDTADHDRPTMQSALLPSARPDEHSPLHMLSYSLASPAATDDAVAQEGGSPHAASTVAANWHGAADVTPGSATLAVPAAAANFSAQPAALLPSQSGPDHVAAFADNLFDQFVAPPAHTGTVVVTAPAPVQSSSVTPAIPDPAHGVDLGTISPVALEILLGWPLTGSTDASSPGATSGGLAPTADAAHTSTATQSADTASPPSSSATSSGSPPTADTSATSSSTDVASSPPSLPVATSSGSPPPANAAATSSSTDVAPPPSSVAAVTAAAPATSPPAAPATIVIAADPDQALGQLLDYGLTSHPMTGAFTVSPVLALVLPVYTAEVSQPVRLIVFDSASVSLPIFELTQGVVFVSDHQLGVSPAQALPANVVTVDLASGGTMTLLGVVDTAHLTY